METKNPPKKSRKINPALCQLERLAGGMKGLLTIFRYLRQDDLARASCVATMWQWLASSREFWETIQLGGIKVCDWEKLVKVIKKHKSTRLDMRGMKTFDDKNRTWHCFAAALQGLQSIKRIDFGIAPVSILHTVADKLLHLEVLTAEWITDASGTEESTSYCRLDIGKFSQLKELTKLKLRGVQGIQIPSVISGLDTLSRLSYLSITSLKDIPPADYDFFKLLVNLVTLELGECTTWTDEHYEYLSNLKRLKRLRLECSASLPQLGFAKNITALKRLECVELYNFYTDELTMRAFRELPNLKLLSVWPVDRQDAILANSVVYRNISGLRLQQLIWGVAVEKTKRPASSKELDKDEDEVIQIDSDDENSDGSTTCHSSDNNKCIPLYINTSLGRQNSKLYLSFIDLTVKLMLQFKNTHVQLFERNSNIGRSRIKM